MGEKTGITWCDATFNPWIGCTKVSQGCAHCYAETQNKRYNWTAGWGPGAPRRRTSLTNWAKPIVWAKRAAKDGIIRRVFCASLADVFDDEAPAGARADLFRLIYATGEFGGLEWLILTKRPENIARLFPSGWIENPPVYIRMGVTCEDYENAERRIPELLAAWRGKNFISYEPALTLVDFWPWLGDFPKLDWIIMGGESGPGCRPMREEWVEIVARQCRLAKVPFFMKQLGGHPDKRHDPAQWPADLRIQQFPED